MTRPSTEIVPRAAAEIEHTAAREAAARDIAVRYAGFVGAEDLNPQERVIAVASLVPMALEVVEEARDTIERLNGEVQSAGIGAMVRDFHLRYGQPAPATAAIDREALPLRNRLIREELDELAAAIAEDDIAHVAKEIADLLYVVAGMAVTFGIPLDAVLAEVHRSNLSKVWADGAPRLRGDGKVLKPPTYAAPDIAAVLRAAGAL